MSSDAEQSAEGPSSLPGIKEEVKLETSLNDLFSSDTLDLDIKPETVKPDIQEDVSLAKHEDLGGDVEIKEDDEGQPVLTRNPTLKAIKREPILWSHVPSASEEAALAFQELDHCTYQAAHLGSTGQEEVMSCDCKPEIGADGENYACGDDSDCINRLTSMECTDDECSCGSRCANQRFQLREYANVDVFHAGRKGYGLRALADLDKDMFVYEYIGEVINERRFRQRQREYEEQGEKHFYFMMLQKGEYIDATKKGGFGRFINHSCEPNCYVDKWVVGSKLRMGIFTKKAIVKGEELSFDYNVDRYGGEATPCYCGEPTCIGYIGGKTQTEAANKLPQSVVEALGIDDDDDWDDAKPKNARRRKKGQDDEEYVNELVPRGIREKDVPKIMAALLQASERWLLKKLLQRISDDANENIQSKIVALHGYQTLGAKIEKWKHDIEISTLILQVLQKWPTITKNKISSSKIETHVKAFLDDEEVTQEVKDLSSRLLETWSTLEMAYRIPRRIKPPKPENGGEEKGDKAGESPTTIEVPTAPRLPLQVRDTQRPKGPRNPSYRSDQGWRRHDGAMRGKDANGRPFGGMATPLGPRTGANAVSAPSQPSTPVKIDPISQDLQAIIDAATKKQQEQAAAQKLKEEKDAAEETARLEAEAEKRADRARRHLEYKQNKEKMAAEKRQSQRDHKESKDRSSSSKHQRRSTPSAESQRRYEHILAKFVPNVIAKYQDRLSRDQIKKRAKEIVKSLVAKEMKRDQPEMTELSDSKKHKIKIYAREFMDKVIARSAQVKRSSDTAHSNGEQAQNIEDDTAATSFNSGDSPNEPQSPLASPGLPLSTDRPSSSSSPLKRAIEQNGDEGSEPKQAKIA